MVSPWLAAGLRRYDGLSGSGAEEAAVQSEIPEHEDRSGAPAGIAVRHGGVADIDALEPLWLELHRVHQTIDPGAVAVGRR